MIRADFHTHTVFCDGRHTPREMAEEAVRRGMTALGLCVHSYTFFDESYCVKQERVPLFQKEIAALKEEYKGRLRLYAGVEQDLYAVDSTAGFDYVIGSSHYVKCGERYYPIDESRDSFLALVHDVFDGDYYALAEAYFAGMSEIVPKTGCDFIGHFDLVTKYNEGEVLFSERDPRYLRAAFAAADRSLAFGVPFEINTGAISRGYRTAPYPQKELLSYIKERGGRFVLSSDSHKRDTLLFGFSELDADPSVLDFIPKSAKK